MKALISKCVFLIPILSVLMLSPAFADTLSVTEYQVTASIAYETSPTLGSSLTQDLVVYTLVPLESSGFGPGQIWYQPLNNGAPDGPRIQVTFGTTDNRLNDVSGDYIVFTAFDSVGSDSGTIMLYQMSTGSLQPLGSALVINEARIHGRVVVWMEGHSFSTQVMLYSLDWLGTGQNAIVLAGPVPPAIDVQIGERYVVWAQEVNGQYDVAAFYLPTFTNVDVASDMNVDELDPATSGEWIVYQTQAIGAIESQIIAQNPSTSETVSWLTTELLMSGPASTTI